MVPTADSGEGWTTLTDVSDPALTDSALLDKNFQHHKVPSKPRITSAQGKAGLSPFLCGYSCCDFLFLLILTQPEEPGGRQVVPVLKQV